MEKLFLCATVVHSSESQYKQKYENLGTFIMVSLPIDLGLIGCMSAVCRIIDNVLFSQLTDRTEF